MPWAQSSSSLRSRRGPRWSRPSPCCPRAPHGADLPLQPWRNLRCSSGCGLKEMQPTELHRSRAWAGAAAHGEELQGAEGLGKPEQCPKDGPHDIEPQWSNAWRAAAHGKPTWDQLRKDSIYGRGTPGVGEDAEDERATDDGVFWTDCKSHSLQEELEEGRWEEVLFCF